MYSKVQLMGVFQTNLEFFASPDTILVKNVAEGQLLVNKKSGICLNLKILTGFSTTVMNLSQT